MTTAHTSETLNADHNIHRPNEFELCLVSIFKNCDISICMQCDSKSHLSNVII